MRKLPIYFLVDTSESSLIGKATDCMDRILCGIRQDPYLLETAFISIITIGKNPNIVLPLTDNCIIKSLPRLECEKGVGLGKTLELLIDDIDKNVVKSTIERKGDWRPIIFLFINHTPTDEYSTILNQWKLNYGRNTFFSVMSENSANFLKSISNAILSYDKMKDVAPAIIKRIAFYPIEAPICTSQEEEIRHFNTDLNNFLNREF